MKIKTIVRPWGSSLGIILPKEMVHSENLKPREEVFIEIIKKQDISQLFGTLKSKKSAQELKNEARKGWN
jgi:antitoxin component of MazEF toxin-antitoxin module